MEVQENKEQYIDTYCGKRLEDMTKEELIDALRCECRKRKYEFEERMRQYNVLRETREERNKKKWWQL